MTLHLRRNTVWEKNRGKQMRIALISFTEQGMKEARAITEYLQTQGHQVESAVKCSSIEESIEETLKLWTKRQFTSCDALIFIGACGIAVRSIAPYVQSKTSDPAVLVIDEKGKYCIPVLSGHIGGANDLANELGRFLGAEAVITTATDLNNKWAVDVFAGKNQLTITDMDKAKSISARLLRGEQITFRCDGTVKGGYPDEVVRCAEDKEADIYVGFKQNKEWKRSLNLIPKAVVLGIGCKKGTEEHKISEAVSATLLKHGLFPESICKAASIELKKEEPGLVDYCRRCNISLETYGADALEQLEGSFTPSDFVKQTTGVDNVCERSALAASEGGKLIVKKQVCSGVTVALAEKEWGICFE